MRLGIDFGTSNSAVAVVGEDGHPRMLELVPGEPVQRTVIYCDPRGQLWFGNQGFKKYVEDDLEGRLIRSLKSFLSQDVPKTHLGGRGYTFTELITLYLRYLIRESERVLGTELAVVHGGRGPEEGTLGAVQHGEVHVRLAPWRGAVVGAAAGVVPRLCMGRDAGTRRDFRWRQTRPNTRSVRRKQPTQ